MAIDPQVSRRHVNLRALKVFVRERLPSGSPLREVILIEDNEIPVNEFVGKIKTWLTLLWVVREE